MQIESAGQWVRSERFRICASGADCVRTQQAQTTEEAAEGAKPRRNVTRRLSAMHNAHYCSRGRCPHTSSTGVAPKKLLAA